MIKSNTRGSEWRKWDLHIHSSASDGNGSPSDIIDVAISKGLSAIAITDHHTVDNLDEIKQIGRERGVLVISGIEFRTEYGAKSVHMIGLFPDYHNEVRLDAKAIEDFILSPLSLSKTHIISLGRRSKPTENLTDEQAFKEGMFLCQVDFKDAANLIRKYGGIISVHAGSKANSIDEEIKHQGKSTKNVQELYHSLGTLKEELLNGYVDICEIRKENDSEDFYLNKFGLPSIIASDAHKIEEIGTKFIWIKADLSFEGLKQIIHEPKDRVRIQELKPDSKDDKLVISEVKFTSDKSDFFTPETIRFNQNLNVIIGGKSSGKSILIFLLAKTLLKREDAHLLHKSEDERNALKYLFNNKLELCTTIGSGQSSTSNRDKDVPSILPEIKYIPQNYLSKLAEPEGFKTGDSLRKLVRDLILEENNANAVYNNFIDNLKNDDKNREVLINEYFEIQNKIKLLKQQLSAKGDEGVLKSSIENNNKELESLKKDAGLTPELVEKYNELKRNQEQILTNAKKLHEDYKTIQTFNEEAGRILGNLNNQSIELLKSELNEEVINLVSPYYEKIQVAHTGIVELYELLTLNEENKFRYNNLFAQKFKILREQKDNLEKSLEPFVKNEEIKKKIKELEDITTRDTQKLKDIDSFKSLIEIEEKNLMGKKNEIFNQIRNTYHRYGKIITDLYPRTSKLGAEMRIFGATKYNFPKLRRVIEEVSDGRRQSYKDYPIFENTLLGTSEFEIENIIQNLKSVFEGIIEAETFKIKDSIDKKYAINKLLYDYFFDNWDVEYRGDNLGEMSAGKASFVILMLIVGLSESKAPILIDQPEDNLDNRSISQDMVEFLRERKSERQIILVTHNPNIVVNADAENVVVANQKGQNDRETSSAYQFDYINGALENTFRNLLETDLLRSMGIREHIADIVEGGEEAFLKRERKYNFKK